MFGSLGVGAFSMCSYILDASPTWHVAFVKHLAFQLCQQAEEEWRKTLSRHIHCLQPSSIDSTFLLQQPPPCPCKPVKVTVTTIRTCLCTYSTPSRTHEPAAAESKTSSAVHLWHSHLRSWTAGRTPRRHDAKADQRPPQARTDLT